MNRSNRASIAKETVEIVDRGWYEINDSGRVDVTSQIEACLSATVLYRPAELDEIAMDPAPTSQETMFEVHNETSLAAARRLVVERSRSGVLVLNFASAKNPGGGFLGGSQAQEESLARSSALYASLHTQAEYYEANRACRTALYTDHMILSPDVPVFRNDDGGLLPEPYMVGILTAPAVNAGAVKVNEPANVTKILPIMANRIGKVLAVASHHGYKHLVLGAWGCGVFRNDPRCIAELFSNALLQGGPHSGVFQSVTFAVLDKTADMSIIKPFSRYFGGGIK